MARTRKPNSLRGSAVSCTFISALAGLGVIFALILLFAYLITKIDLSDTIISVLTSAALCVGAYTGGLISAKKRRKNGLLMGILCGVFMFFIIFIISSFFAQTAAGFSGSSKLVMTLIFAAVGGVVGINSKNNRY